MGSRGFGGKAGRPGGGAGGVESCRLLVRESGECGGRPGGGGALGGGSSAPGGGEPGGDLGFGKFCKFFAKFCKFLAGSFSAVSKQNFARKYAFDSIFQALQDVHTFAPLRSQNFSKKSV